jgi:hypothetical protein
MAKLIGIREQRVQFFYDTDINATGVVTSGRDMATSSKPLFTTSPGDKVRTNMPAGGFLTGDQTFLIFAVRHEILIYGGAVREAEAITGFNTTAAVAAWAIAMSTFELSIEQKLMFEGPVTMSPAGGGPSGFVGELLQPLINNGEPSNKAIYVLPLPVPVTKRQGIKLEERKHQWTTPGSVGANILDMLNYYTGGKLIRAYIDGFNTRDVQ